MAPKRVDPETRERDFEAYRQGDQFKKIDEICEYIRVVGPSFISETSKEYDLNGKYQILWDKLYELSGLMKVKSSFKKIQHQWMRSIYFGQKKKVDKNDAVYSLDGVICEFQPVDADSQHHLRQALIKKITNNIRDKDNFDIDNYTKTRSELKKGITEMFSLLKSYVKKSFKVIYEEKFMEAIKPFSDLLEINLKLVMFELKYTHEDDKYINDFKRNAIVEKYCQSLEKALQILMSYQNKPILFKIKPANVFKKLGYDKLTKIQSFYLGPFRESFDSMKKGLCALFTTGINFWKVPMEENKKFVEDLKILVNWELVTERHFGNSLVRQQINFMADSLGSIDKANEQSRKYMISRDPNCMEIAIPRLVAFRTIQYMRNWKDKEAEIDKKQMQIGRQTSNFRNKKEEEDGKAITSSHLGSKQGKLVEGLDKSKVSKVNSQGPVVDEYEEERIKLGTYWIWDNYCDNQFRDTVIEEAVEMLKHINKAVQQDIQDTIVREAMLPRRDRHDEERVLAADNLKNMKTYHNADKGQNMRRPPELWNFPRVIEEQHKFRSIADPKKCYVDGRIELMDQKLMKIGNYFKNYNQRDWNELVRRVIDFYDGKRNSDPAFESI